MATGIGSPLALGGLYPSVDGRYVAANGKPFTSVSNAESALNGFPSKLSESCVGLTVLVKESGWTEAKEYWVQPYDNNGVTAYHLVEKQPQIDTSGFATKTEVNAKQDALPSGTAGQILKKTTNSVEWGDMPSIEDGESTAVTLDGTIHVSAVDAQEDEGARVEITPHTGGGIDMTFTLPKGNDVYEVYLEKYKEEHSGSTDGAMSKTEWLASLKGEKGNDGHNPCLGVFADASSLPTTDVQEGDYAYADVTDSTTQTTASHIFRYDGSEWQDNGEGSPDNQTAFDGGTGPTVAGTKIDDTELANPASNAIAKAADVKAVSDVVMDEVDVEMTNPDYLLTGWSINTNGNWAKAASLRSYLIPVEDSRRLRIAMAAAEVSDSGRFAFLPSLPEFSDDLAGTQADLVTAKFGTQNTSFFYCGTSTNPSPQMGVIPDGCAYVWIAKIPVTGSADRTPESVTMWKYKQLVTDEGLPNKVSDIVLSEHVIDLESARFLPGVISSETLNWEGLALSRYNSIVVPVVPGQIFTMEKENLSRYAFLRSVPDVIVQDSPADVIAVDGVSYFYCGNGSSNPANHSPKKFVIPDGCNFLWVSRSNGNSQRDSLPDRLSYKLIDSTEVVSSASGLDMGDEYVRSSAVGLTETNAVPLVEGDVYGCSGAADAEVKHVDYDGYFGTAMKILVKMASGNSHSSPKLTVGVSAVEYPVYYNEAAADALNTWFDGELVWLQYDGVSIVLTKYDKTQIAGTDSVAVKVTSVQQQNLLRLANRYRFAKWSPLKNETVDGFKVGIPQHSHNGTPTYRSTVAQSYGIPYSSAAQDQKYVGLNVSVHTFLSAVHNPYSLLYTETINSGTGMKSAWGRSYHGSNSSAYFGLVCCGFTAAVTGSNRNWNNGDFPIVSAQGKEFVNVATGEAIKFDQIRVGDVFDNPEHSVAIYQVFQDVKTGKVTHVRFAECTSEVKGCRFCLMTVAAFRNYMALASGGKYSQYRYIKLYQNYLDDVVLREFSLPTDPKDIALNYDKVSVTYDSNRVDNGSYDTASADAETYTDEICTIAGDKATFPVGNFSIGNIIALNYDLAGSYDGNSALMTTYDRIKVYRRDNGATGSYTLAGTYMVNAIDKTQYVTYLRNHTLTLPRPEDGPSAGEYYACLANGSVDSEAKTYWEVLDCDTTITAKPAGYEVVWGGDVVALNILLINDAVSPDPYPWFSGFGASRRAQSMVSLDSRNIAEKKYMIENWRLAGVDTNKVYVRLLVRGIYGITGVYKKLT